MSVSSELLAAERDLWTRMAQHPFLLDSAADYGVGLAALYPCMWGYSTLGRRLAAEGAPHDHRYRAWIETYADPGFAALADRIGEMLDEAAPDPEAATAAFLEGMDHELAFWDVPASEAVVNAQARIRG